MNTSWNAWVRELADLSPTAKLIAYELAMLADMRGVAVVSLEHLEKVSSRSRRSVRTALEQLSHRRYLRGPEAMPPPLRGMRLQLVRPAIKSGDSPPHSPVTPARLPPECPDSADPDVLRDLLREAVEARWSGPACWALAALLEKQGPQRFASLIGRRRGAGVTDPWDTLTLAWEIAQREQIALLSADEPWALWIHLVKNECFRIDTPLGSEQPLDGDTVGFREFHQSAARESFHFGIDDFDSNLWNVVRTLVELGLDETTACAGTARVMELVGVGGARRHWLAGRDAKLQALGVGEDAARAWMTLLVGSRRGRPGALTGGNREASHAHALAVVTAME